MISPGLSAMLLPDVTFGPKELTMAGTATGDFGVGPPPGVHTTITYRITRDMDTDYDGIPNSADSSPLSADPFP